jgi:phosphodiesterase/alkaline phosphatase D-like protein
MSLVLGPLLRHVDQSSALIWVQTDQPATVSVLGHRAQTFEVQGHHYALIKVSGLEPDSCTPYQVELDGQRVWPPDHSFPPSVIRTRGPESAHRARLVFGSCRYPMTGEPALDDKIGHDAMNSYAERMATLPTDHWADALILLGDQVYADELTTRARRSLATRRLGRTGSGKRPPDEVVTFGEYEQLYRTAWSRPAVRWLMSTVPTAMIFDDHDVRDDWNTSAAWRAQMSREPWWSDRIQAALASYWIYQHLGNLSPAELDADRDYQRLVTSEGDRWPLLAELAQRADREVDAAKGVRFSFRWDLGNARLIMIDSRNGRILEGGERKMLGEREFAWVAEQAQDGIGELDHVVFGSSLPWLLPHAISDLQTINELAAQRDGWRGALAERARQAADLEHWPAFGASFARLSELLVRIGKSGPATVTVLSGDVHHSYVARRVDPADPVIYQLTCSPVHNYVPRYLRPMFRLGWSRRIGGLTRRWARHAGAPPLPVTWRKVTGPLFGNLIATLLLDGRRAEVVFEEPRSHSTLDEAARVAL